MSSQQYLFRVKEYTFDGAAMDYGVKILSEHHNLPAAMSAAKEAMAEDSNKRLKVVVYRVKIAYEPITIYDALDIEHYTH